jgi:dihydroflavonol-4-reductase
MAQTVLLTGASGFIAKHVVRSLVDAGYTVRGTVRRLERGDEVRDAVRPNLADDSGLAERLTFVVADLEDDSGWAEAMDGVDAVVHCASPFPIAQPKDESVLIRPAVEGTLRVLRAAHEAGVDKVVLTSSVAAIVHGDLPEGRDTYDEDDWTDLQHKTVTAYIKSKTLAERAAWDFVANEAPDMALTAINPGFVVGPALDGQIGGSLSVVVRLLSGKDPMLPRHGIPVVDVRDVAEAHLRALQRPEAAGRRYAVAAGSMWFAEMGAVLKAAHPERKIATRTAPNMAMRLLGLFDREVRIIVPSLGIIERLSNERATTELGMTFIAPDQSIRDTAQHLIEHDLV